MSNTDTAWRKAWPPIDLALIGTCLKKRDADYDLLLYDAQLDKDYHAMMNSIERSQAEVFILNCTTPTFHYDIALARNIKSIYNRAFIIFFGLHAATLPMEIMQNSVVDCCVTDEAEEVIPDVCGIYFDQGRDALNGVSNIVFRSESGSIVTTAKKITLP